MARRSFPVMILVGASVCVAPASARALLLKGTFAGEVTSARDPGQASFGRDPADWIGRDIFGAFVIDTENVAPDRDPSPTVWDFSTFLGTVKYVDIVAVVDGVEFGSKTVGVPAEGSLCNGVVVGDTASAEWFWLQDAYVRTGARSLVGLNSYFDPGPIEYSGLDSFAFSAGASIPGFLGYGIVTDLVEASDAAARDGEIFFSLSEISVGAVPIAAVPEPSTLPLVGAGLFGLIGWNSRRGRKKGRGLQRRPDVDS